jgi:hypothetical protein
LTDQGGVKRRLSKGRVIKQKKKPQLLGWGFCYSDLPANFAEAIASGEIWHHKLKHRLAYGRQI